MTGKVAQRNNVKITGSGDRTIVFAHGFGCDQNMWRFVAPEFENDFRVVLFDYVGCGNSDLSAYDPKRYASLDGYSKDILEICEELSLSDVIFVGHSVSGMIGALAAIENPEFFESLIMVVPSPCYINDPPYVGGFERADVEGLLGMMEKNFIGWANFLAPVIMQNPERPELTEELESSFCSTDPEFARRFARATFYADNRKDLEKIETPTLIIQVTEDAVAPVEVGRYMNERIKNSELQMLEASGHCPHMSHPKQTTEIIRSFIAKF